MNSRSKIAALAAGTAMIAMQTAPAVAEGTSAGTTITNTATVDYRVGGVDQTEIVASDSFDVDRKVNFVIARVSDPTTTVVPGQTNAVIAFDITNLSNATIDLGLVVNQSGSDDFDADNVAIYLDDGNGTFDGTETAITFLDEIPEDQTVRVLVVANIALTHTNGEVASLVLSGTAGEGGAAGSQGAVITSTAGANTAGVETVLADGAGADDGTNDGVFGAGGSYTVSAATLDVTKTSRVISDPVNNTANPKAIPGATIEYCVTVGNAAGSATATNVTITDPLPGDLTFDAVFGIRINGTSDGSGNCNADGVTGGSFSAGSVTATLDDIPGNDERTVYFRATIN
ncbi:MAG: DUF11 domain-containing protein [Porphyrobacter sp. IPPAS B-1204]|nr:MAG: DUF11 domain-containing protein [Porphyrobacter sp. IPPAS B-1204]